MKTVMFKGLTSNYIRVFLSGLPHEASSETKLKMGLPSEVPTEGRGRRRVMIWVTIH